VAKVSKKKNEKKTEKKTEKKNKQMSKKSKISKSTQVVKAAKKSQKAPAKKAAVQTPAKKTPAKKAAPKVVKKAGQKAPAKKASAATEKIVTSAAKKAAPKVVKPQISDWSQVLSPLDDRVLVSMAEVTETKTKSGLILLEGSEDQEQCRGRVEAVGRGHLSKKGKIRPLDLQIGDQILFPKFAGAKVTVEGQDLFILREGEVLGVIASSTK